MKCINDCEYWSSAIGLPKGQKFVCEQCANEFHDLCQKGDMRAFKPNLEVNANPDTKDNE